MATYYDTAEGLTITAARAWVEFDKQGLGRDSIDGTEFREWLSMKGFLSTLKTCSAGLATDT